MADSPNLSYAVYSDWNIVPQNINERKDFYSDRRHQIEILDDCLSSSSEVRVVVRLGNVDIRSVVAPGYQNVWAHMLSKNDHKNQYSVVEIALIENPSLYDIIVHANFALIHTGDWRTDLVAIGTTQPGAIEVFFRKSQLAGL